MGLVTQLVEDSDLEEIVLALADEITPLAPLSQRRHKVILQNVINNQSLDGLDQDLPFTNFDSADFHEGKEAFISRRVPKFQGK
jgi:1,4-dihydroxy-2-naphthoyl-CoA synthase